MCGDGGSGSSVRAIDAGVCCGCPFARCAHSVRAGRALAAVLREGATPLLARNASLATEGHRRVRVLYRYTYAHTGTFCVGGSTLRVGRWRTYRRCRRPAVG